MDNQDLELGGGGELITAYRNNEDTFIALFKHKSSYEDFEVTELELIITENDGTTASIFLGFDELSEMLMGALS